MESFLSTLNKQRQLRRRRVDVIVVVVVVVVDVVVVVVVAAAVVVVVNTLDSRASVSKQEASCLLLGEMALGKKCRNVKWSTWEQTQGRPDHPKLLVTSRSATL